MPATAKSSFSREDQIAALAHSFWEQDGRPEGRAEEHWLRAAVLVDGEGAPKAVTARKPVAKKLRKVS
ncbi:MAG: DUF2934 domain-containing protein [Aestuariivirga sp.]